MSTIENYREEKNIEKKKISGEIISMFYKHDSFECLNSSNKLTEREYKQKIPRIIAKLGAVFGPTEVSRVAFHTV
jgi:hypothetical protein